MSRLFFVFFHNFVIGLNTHHGIVKTEDNHEHDDNKNTEQLHFLYLLSLSDTIIAHQPYYVNDFLLCNLCKPLLLLGFWLLIDEKRFFAKKISLIRTISNSARADRSRAAQKKEEDLLVLFLVKFSEVSLEGLPASIVIEDSAGGFLVAPADAERQIQSVFIHTNYIAQDVIHFFPIVLHFFYLLFFF